MTKTTFLKIEVSDDQYKIIEHAMKMARLQLNDHIDAGLINRTNRHLYFKRAVVDGSDILAWICANYMSAMVVDLAAESEIHALQ